MTIAGNRLMKFYPPNAPVPDLLQTEEFLLRPLRPGDSALDYDAVIASQDLLRRRTGGKWPHIGFSAKANRADLEQHAIDFRDRRGFTYTVLDPAQTRCLGCVYVDPLPENLRLTQAAVDNVASAGAYQALVSFWVRSDVVPRDIDRYLLTELLQWLKTDFAFTRVVFASWQSDVRQMMILRDAGLHQTTIASKGDTEAVYFE
jgi:hypothetical protein